MLALGGCATSASAGSLATPAAPQPNPAQSVSPAPDSPAPGSPTPLTADQQAALDLAQAAVTALQAEDLPGFLATLHSQSPLIARAQAQLPDLFATYDVHYTFRNLQIEDMPSTPPPPGGQRVEFALDTVKDSGPLFDDNNAVGVFIIAAEADGTLKIDDEHVYKQDTLGAYPQGRDLVTGFFTQDIVWG